MPVYKILVLNWKKTNDLLTSHKVLLSNRGFVSQIIKQIICFVRKPDYVFL